MSLAHVNGAQPEPGWKQCSEADYDYGLCVLPPALWLSHGFLVGEPFDHRVCTVTGYTAPTFAAFVRKDDKFYNGPNMTVAEFRAIDLGKVP
jgi:hypothetical protein